MGGSMESTFLDLGETGCTLFPGASDSPRKCHRRCGWKDGLRLVLEALSAGLSAVHSTDEGLAGKAVKLGVNLAAPSGCSGNLGQNLGERQGIL